MKSDHLATKLAEEYGVGKSTITSIKNNERTIKNYLENDTSSNALFVSCLVGSIWYQDKLSLVQEKLSKILLSERICLPISIDNQDSTV